MASAETTRITGATRTHTGAATRTNTDTDTTSSTPAETRFPEETTISMVKTDM